MKYKVINFLLIIFLSINVVSSEIPPYSAKYNFESEEISISGVREFYKTENGHEMRFKASNLFASLFFLSKFEIENGKVISDSYEIKSGCHFYRVLCCEYSNKAEPYTFCPECGEPGSDCACCEIC